MPAQLIRYTIAGPKIARAARVPEGLYQAFLFFWCNKIKPLSVS